ncbi:hypothetical protein DJ568_15595 [Mucilaginibacter hurinus]|uniref:Uncharacterized protein n=1 Tax=Mucilaginibacter hurinus TaxID=2201324 RepID=A0A367GKG9_9SPHI|nr:hypothetical protein [Mucilaginibacter hurinus]RCH53962.1 hypothetical protein DJ568_15595 [Mucilaginibacter hurinus]
MQKKSFKITCGLKEGYEPDGRLFTFEDAEKVVAGWMNTRLAGNEPIVSGMLQAGTIIFPAPEKAPERVSVTPTVIFTGELSGEEDMSRDDGEVRATLESLASLMKDTLLQESVFVTYLDKHWCV